MDILLPSSNPISPCMPHSPPHSPLYEPYPADTTWPCVIVVKLWVDRALVLGELRSHSSRQVFWMLKCWGLTPVVIFTGAFFLPKFHVRQSLWSESLEGAEEHFHVISATRRDAFGGIRCRGEWKMPCWALPKIYLPILVLSLFTDVRWCPRLHFRS